MRLQHLRPRLAGRIGRRRFCLELLGLIVATLALEFLIALGAVQFSRSEPLFDSLSGAVGLAATPWLASIYVRRLHDAGRAGWWALLPCSVSTFLTASELVEAWTADFNPYRVPGIGLAMLLMIVSAGVVFVLCLVRRGEPRDNKFGPPPGQGWTLSGKWLQRERVVPNRSSTAEQRAFT